ncbi:hypothetical protein D3C71_1874300 [compost metagenome]
MGHCWANSELKRCIPQNACSSTASCWLEVRMLQLAHCVPLSRWLTLYVEPQGMDA